MRTAPDSSSIAAAPVRESVFFSRSLLFAGAVAGCLMAPPVRAQDAVDTMDVEITRTHPVVSWFTGSETTINRIFDRNLAPVPQQGDLVFSPYSQPGVHWTTHVNGDTDFDAVQIALIERSNLIKLAESGVNPLNPRVHWFEQINCIALADSGIDACRDNISRTYDREYDACIDANEYRAAVVTGDTDLATVRRECVDDIIARHPGSLLMSMELAAPLRPVK